MENALPSPRKVATFMIATFLIAFPAMIIAYRMAT